MSAPKHTPGPWKLHPSSWRERAYVVPASHASRHIGASSDRQQDRDEYAQQVCVVAADIHGRGDHIVTANLIAAAPDMLEALIDVIAGHSDPDLFMPQVRAAVRKATGGAA